jgi:hypothetical protein
MLVAEHSSFAAFEAKDLPRLHFDPCARPLQSGLDRLYRLFGNQSSLFFKIDDCVDRGTSLTSGHERHATPTGRSHWRRLHWHMFEQARYREADQSQRCRPKGHAAIGAATRQSRPEHTDFGRTWSGPAGDSAALSAGIQMT